MGISTTLEVQGLDVNLMPLVLKMSLVYVIVHLIDNIFFQPIIFSSSIKAHPLEIFILIWVAATLGGVVGMIIAIPCYTVVRVITKEILIEFGWISGDDVPDVDDDVLLREGV